MLQRCACRDRDPNRNQATANPSGPVPPVRRTLRRALDGRRFMAGPLATALATPVVAAGLERLDGAACRQHTVDALVAIGSIPSPSGDEGQRAAAVADRMREAGLTDVRVTAEPNVIGVLPGRTRRALVFIATLDDLASVAELQRGGGTTPLLLTGQGETVKDNNGEYASSGERIVGPGSNSSVSSAAILAAAGVLVEGGYDGERTLVFAGVAQEETGMVGMKALYEEFRGTADAFVDVLGDGHSVTYGALAIHWWQVMASGVGAHTLRGGLPHVNQAIGRAVDRILSLPEAANTWEDTEEDRAHRTRLNIAMISSGQVFNHKPCEKALKPCLASFAHGAMTKGRCVLS